MSDELDRLRDGLKAAPPAPNPEARTRALRLAMESFDRRQETLAAARPMSDRPKGAGFPTGVRQMLAHLSPRAALAATASVAVIGLALALYPELRQGTGLPAPRPEATADKAETLPAAPVEAPAESRLAAPAEAPSATLADGIADAIANAPAADAADPADARRKAEGEAVAGAAPLSAPEAASVAAADPTGAGTSTLARIPPVAPMAEMAQALGSSREAGAYASGEAEAPAPAPGLAAGLTLADDTARRLPAADTEAFANAAPNPVKIAAEEPVSTFSIDTDTASWSVLRSSLAGGVLPPKDSVRIEEMVNYFPYAYPAPLAGAAPFRASVSLFQTPWNAGTQLLRVGLQGRMPAIEDRPPIDLVFLIDTSGSMEDANKLPLLKQSFRLLLGQLRPEDRVAIVTYAGSAGLVLEPTAAGDRDAILGALGRLEAGGSTAGAEGLAQAYQVAESMAGEGRIGRILLATDGDFNVGIDNPEDLKDFIAEKRESGTYLSVLGFGRGNLDDATMQALAQNGNGTAAYIDTATEAQKVLVDQLTGALFPIADDVKVQVEFNPAAVAEYRLIGYETRALAREDFNNDRVDAGEIGAGHQVTALYEITPVGSAARLSDPLRYGAAPGGGDASELGFLKLRWKAPGEATSRLIETPIPAAPGEADTDARFAAAIAGMGQLLGEPKYLGTWGWVEAIALASGAKGEDPYGYRAEAVKLMRLAQSLAR
ncbi:MAG: VWA domain-containing protein [Rhodobacteraceae bacterium]|jgi:Ca-activated chloride channel family protein|uniref:vWA domain-containing protein n=1 Tax=Albidovulum sp. TaxID=1872424 RepID=UPI0026599773|nr:VWA domain-containing protein [uncultured Defluviimonas sp.]MCC0071602.1 VWA domain-containing protein [Paracoccaceae bacterium]